MTEEVRATQRPLIIVFIAISFALGGVLATVVGGGIQFGLEMARDLVPDVGVRGQFTGLLVALLGVALELFGIFSIAAAYGLWTWQHWARSLALGLLLINVVLGCGGLIVNLFSKDRSLGSFFSGLAGTALAGYLFMRLSVLRHAGASVAAPSPSAEKLFCTQCGTQVRAGSVVCTNCGGRL